MKKLPVASALNIYTKWYRRPQTGVGEPIENRSLYTSWVTPLREGQSADQSGPMVSPRAGGAIFSSARMSVTSPCPRAVPECFEKTNPQPCHPLKETKVTSGNEYHSTETTSEIRRCLENPVLSSINRSLPDSLDDVS
ncbi:hypothetical protein P4O66_015736 [Electrophorus voltai]|uniref:Uncharacterized protein n=1 Tax=Electrophorus voltai TaxID=2609070 RepID=A0AAD8Z014_9TELE|nr:hypothetical protein P4O66_015736 [Electrophorus voltai]